MSKHKSEDYKITAVKYYLENDINYTKRWIERYKEYDEISKPFSFYFVE